MKSQGVSGRLALMILRHVLKFDKSLGITLPRQTAEIMDIHWHDYVEIYLIDDEHLVIRKHLSPDKLNIEYVKREISTTTSNKV